jgi:hypothetical protein
MCSIPLHGNLDDDKSNRISFKSLAASSAKPDPDDPVTNVIDDTGCWRCTRACWAPAWGPALGDALLE